MNSGRSTPASGGNGGNGSSSSSWSAFLKSIASFNGDLSSLTAPPFILSSVSLTEFSSYWCAHPDILTAPAAEKDPTQRAYLVLKWFLSTLHQQYASRSDKYGNEKKPLNPFLGELFLGTWKDDAGTTDLISEQVSHHPPATAYCVSNSPTGVRLQGYNAQKATFNTTICVKQIGHAVLTVPDPSDKAKSDTYLITLPSLHIDGLVYGSPYVELDGSSYITSSTGYTARVDYSGKGWLSGKKNSVTAVMYKTGKEKEVLYSVKGQWNESLDFHNGPLKAQSSKTLIETYLPKKSPVTELAIRPMESQHPLESRRAWSKVAQGIADGNMEFVSVEKSKIEQAQRAIRAKEKAEGRVWERAYFSATKDDRDDILRSLGTQVGLPPDGDSDKTGGLWRFDAAKAEKAKSETLSMEDAAKTTKELLGQE